MSTQLATIPAGMQLPARLQTASAAEAIAAANAAAAGGIKSGGFPKISLNASKFNILENGDLTPMMHAAQGGQPAMPVMCLEIAVVSANPALSKVFFAKEYVKGEVTEPDCTSRNGVTPDSHITSPQSATCAACPQNQWGSKISKFTGKDIKACDDGKQLAVLGAGLLDGKMLGFNVPKGSLGNWGSYVKELIGRNIPVTEIVTNVTFDATANGVLNFSFNRFLNDDEAAKVAERAKGGDVQNIINAAPSAPRAALPAPTAAAPVAAPVAAIAQVIVDPYEGQMVHVKPTVESAGGLTTSEGRAVYKALTGKEYVVVTTTITTTPPPAQPVYAATTTVVPAPSGQPVGATATTGFGAPTAAAQPVQSPAAEPPKRTRRTREQIAADAAAANAGAPAPVAVQPPAQQAVVDPALAHLPANILTAVQAVGKDSPAGQALMAMHPAPVAVATPVTTLIAPPPAVAAPVQVPNIGAVPAATVASAEVVNAAMSLKDKLAARLKQGAGAPAGATIQ